MACGGEKEVHWLRVTCSPGTYARNLRVKRTRCLELEKPRQGRGVVEDGLAQCEACVRPQAELRVCLRVLGQCLAYRAPLGEGPWRSQGSWPLSHGYGRLVKWPMAHYYA